MAERIRAAIVGATGYTGAELVRLLWAHPGVEVTSLVGNRTAGEAVSNVLPSLAGLRGGTIEAFDPADLAPLK